MLPLHFQKELHHNEPQERTLAKKQLEVWKQLFRKLGVSF